MAKAYNKFDRFLQEVIPTEIPVEYIDYVICTYKNGKVTKLPHAELIDPMPIEGGLGWPAVEKNFKNVASIEVHVNTVKLQQRVTARANAMFGKTFSTDIEPDENAWEDPLEKKDNEE